MKKDTTIKMINGREILDSRGNPTVEVDLVLQNGIKARAAVPSGASTGIHEACELRDKDDHRYHGKGVKGAVKAINTEIAHALKGKDVLNQEEIDNIMIELDGTRNKVRFGANGILGVSLASSRAAALSEKMPLYRYLGGSDTTLIPVPMMNVLNGGVHAQWQGADCQEFMIAPHGAESVTEAIRWGSETYHTLQSILKKKGYSTSVGDEGGFAPVVKTNEEPLELIVSSIENAGYRPGKEISIGMDPASSGFFENGLYKLHRESRNMTSEEMVDWYASLISKYPILLIEDGLAEDDWKGWKLLNDSIGNKVELVGDDIFVTNIERLSRGVSENTANSILIKLNQIGTLTETIQTVEMAKKADWGLLISHRSGETMDPYISDLTVAMNAGKLKTGAPARGERVEKYNQLIRIEEEMGDRGRYAGRSAFIR